MVTRLFLKANSAKFLAVCFLLVLLTSCGTQNSPSTGATTTPIPATPIPGISSTSTTNLSNSLTLNQTGISIDKADLHIDVAKGIQCPSTAASTGKPDNPGPVGLKLPWEANNLVLSTDRLTYDSNELKQISDYVDAVTTNGGNVTAAQIPDTLSWVLGGPIGMSRSLNVAGTSSVYFYDCSFEMQITNTGQNTIQIASVGAQLTASPQKNTYQYRLIDECTVIQCQFGGGPGGCSLNYATIKLDTGSPNQVFSASPVAADSSCGELTLNPGDQKGLDVYFYSPQNLIYSVIPQLVLDTSGGQSTLMLSEMTSTLAFADDSQFTCYSLQGDTFVVESPLANTSDCM